MKEETKNTGLDLQTKTKIEEDQRPKTDQEEKALINRFAEKEDSDISEKSKISIEKLREIQNNLNKGEVLRIKDVREFSNFINAGTTKPVSIKNKIYRIYENGEIDLKPIMRDRVLYLKRK